MTVSGIAFAGSQVITASFDGTARVWDGTGSERGSNSLRVPT